MMKIVPYDQSFEQEWDNFCCISANATFLHTRRFLRYHGAKFKDRSLLLFEDQRLVGIFPAAESPNENSVVISHPGITYGGIVHNGWLNGARMLELMSILFSYYKNLGYKKIQYKTLPYIYSLVPSQDDSYGMFRFGAKCIRCELSSTIDLNNRRELSERRKRSLKKSKQCVQVSNDNNNLQRLWAVLSKNLDEKYNAKPVHSYREMKYLSDLFPDNISISCAMLNEELEAGVVVFKTKNVWHAQYIASSELGYKNSALDAVFDSILAEARDSNIRYFDFGTSNENQGRYLNENLYRFKSEFGGGGVACEVFEVDLDDLSPL